jgi:dihydropteroate synthase
MSKVAEATPSPAPGPQPPPLWRLSPHRAIDTSRPALVTIINVTPDSFSDGGLYNTPRSAAAAAVCAAREGAAAIDLGAESTRPGAAAVSAEEQLRRMLPALEAARGALDAAGFRTVAITIDTTKSAVAAAALDAGADAVNDVSAGIDDPAMLPLLAERRRGVVLMHRLTTPANDRYSDAYDAPPRYADVTGEVAAFLAERAAAALAAGIPPGSIAIDPGLGFGKTVEQNLTLIRQTPRLLPLGFPILSGISRKSFTARAAGMDPSLPPSSRLAASVALALAHFAAGARLFRVHDTAVHAHALSAFSAAFSAAFSPASHPPTPA